MTAVLCSSALLACTPRSPTKSAEFEWPLPDIESPTASSGGREIRIHQDFGLGGPGPTIRIIVDSVGVRGESYISHYLVDAEDSAGLNVVKEIEARQRAEYHCRSFVRTKDEAICRVPFRSEPNWARVLRTLDSLRASAPPVLPLQDPNLVCTDYPGWTLTERAGSKVRRDSTGFCGPGSPARGVYEKAMWDLFRRIDKDARFR
jgi:hypothetical protein